MALGLSVSQWTTDSSDTTGTKRQPNGQLRVVTPLGQTINQWTTDSNITGTERQPMDN